MRGYIIKRWASTSHIAYRSRSKNYDSDRLTQLHRLWNILIFCFILLSYYAHGPYSEQQRRRSDRAFAQSDLRLCCLQTKKNRFSYGEAVLMPTRSWTQYTLGTLCHNKHGITYISKAKSRYRQVLQGIGPYSMYTQTKKLCPLDVFVCQFQMYERISFKFSPFKL